MKKYLLIMLFATIVSCEEEESTNPAPINQPPQATTGKVTFYMNEFSGNWNLLVDNVDRGLLDETTQAPVCQDVDFITLELSTGSHTCDAKSMDGFAWGNPKTFTVSQGCVSFKVK